MPDLCCCCNTEFEEDHDLRHVYAVGRYTPSCWRVCLLRIVRCMPCVPSKAGVTYEYGGAGNSRFIEADDSKNVMTLIQRRIDTINS